MVKKNTPPANIFPHRVQIGVGIQIHHENLKQLPATSLQSDAMSKDLKKRGFKFVGSTICYAFMQAVGMVNDHFVDCFRYKEILKLQKAKKSNS